MSNIQTFLNKILSARYGKDVRQSIHDAIQEVDKVADTAQGSATRSAQTAANHEASAKSYATNAQTSESNAKTYAEQAKASAEQAISTTPEGYNDLVNQVGLMDIQTTTDSTLHNSKAGGARLVHMSGNSEQKTYSGKNLAKLSDEGTNWAYTENGIKNLIQNTGRELTRVNLKAGKTYTVSLDMLSKPSGSVSLTGYIDGQSASELLFSNIQTFTKKNSKTYTPTSDCELSYTLWGNEQNETFEFTFQIEENTVATDFEKYVGGIASPNPSFPQVIENTGDCVEMMNGYYQYANGVYNSHKNRVCNKYPIPCKSDDVVKVTLENSGTQLLIVYYNDGGYLSYAAKNNPVSGEEYSFTVPSGATKFNFSITNDNMEITPQTVGKITLTINGKYVVGVKTGGGKNLLKPSTATTNKNGVTLTPTSNGAYSVNGTSNATIHFKIGEVRLTGGKTYSISGGLSADCRFDLRDENGDGVYAYDVGSGASYTPSKDVTVSAYIRISSGTTLSHTLYLQIEEGNVATPYEPYTESTAYILLDEPLRKVGDVADRIVEVDGVWGVERRVGELIGTNTNGFYLSSSGNFAYFGCANNPSTIYTLTEIAPLYCTHSISKSIKDIDEAKTNGIGIYPVDSRFHIRVSGFTTLAEYKELVQTDDFKIVYPLATPTFTPLDTESQKALTQLKTFNSVTYVEVDSKIQPSEVEVQYGASEVGALALENECNQKLHKLEAQETKEELLVELSENLYVKTLTASGLPSYAVTGGGTSLGTSLDGYIPIGIVGTSVSANSGTVSIRTARIKDGYAMVNFVSSEDTYVSLAIDVLYKKNQI